MPSNVGTWRPDQVDNDGWLAGVACVALFAVLDLSFQQPTAVVGAPPEQLEEANIVAASAPSSQSFRLAPLRIPAG